MALVYSSYNYSTIDSTPCAAKDQGNLSEHCIHLIENITNMEFDNVMTKNNTYNKKDLCKLDKVVTKRTKIVLRKQNFNDPTKRGGDRYAEKFLIALRILCEKFKGNYKKKRNSPTLMTQAKNDVAIRPRGCV